MSLKLVRQPSTSDESPLPEESQAGSSPHRVGAHEPAEAFGIIGLLTQGHTHAELFARESPKTTSGLKRQAVYMGPICSLANSSFNKRASGPRHATVSPCLLDSEPKSNSVVGLGGRDVGQGKVGRRTIGPSDSEVVHPAVDGCQDAVVQTAVVAERLRCRRLAVVRCDDARQSGLRRSAPVSRERPISEQLGRHTLPVHGEEVDRGGVQLFTGPPRLRCECLTTARAQQKLRVDVHESVEHGRAAGGPVRRRHACRREGLAPVGVPQRCIEDVLLGAQGPAVRPREVAQRPSDRGAGGAHIEHA
mmetsp:Transcript_17070/g.55142  ORF Transcript_17070/g.55142 Transcript_17070/m.55142 type:complete len:305 (-) Transcript_17070:120-1034(-)